MEKNAYRSGWEKIYHPPNINNNKKDNNRVKLMGII